MLRLAWRLTLTLSAGLACALPAGAQTRAWTARFDGGGASDPNTSTWKHSVAVDAAGNVYVTGSASVGGGSDCLLVKYAPDGETAWSARYEGTGSESCYAVAVGPGGQVYVTGGTGLGDAFLLQYDAQGALQWARAYAGSAGLSDYGRNLAIDATGRVYVTGYSYTRTGDEGEFDADSFTLAYDSAGNRL